MSAHRLAGLLAVVAGAALLTGCAHLVVLHDPLTASEHNDLGVVYESSGQLPLAGKEYKKALRLDPHDARARVNLGNIEAANERWRAAEKKYRRALQDSSTNYDAMNNLAIALVRQKRGFDEALTLAERAAAAGGEREPVYRATVAEVKATVR